MHAYLPEPPPTAQYTRLDGLLPVDPTTEAITEEALHTYIAVSLEMMQRTGGNLSIVAVSLDESPLLQFLGMEGSQLIARSLAQYLRQESRLYDVVGSLSTREQQVYPTMVLVAPLSNEAQATSLAKRVCERMHYTHAHEQRPWISLSIGVTASRWDTASPVDLLTQADNARQHAEGEGGGRIIRYSQIYS